MQPDNIAEDLIKTGPGVFRTRNDVAFISHDQIEWLKGQALLTEKKRARICLHKTDDDPIHEMIIAVHNTSFISPHLHPHKEESLHLIQGDCDVLLFSDKGIIESVTRLNAENFPKSGMNYFYRIAKNIIHGLKLHSEWIVFHEVAAGPLKPDGNVIPDFVPKFDDDMDAVAWVNQLSKSE